MADESTKQAAPEKSEAAVPEASTTSTAAAPRSSGPRSSSGPRQGGRPGGSGRDGGRKFFRRKKVCKFCTEKIDSINYKDVRLLSGFVAESGKIVPRRLTGVCTPHQRRVTAAIKQARNIALLPFAAVR